MRRVAFLYDGFNLYHSLREASRDLGGAGTRWLDLVGLSRGLLPALGRDVRLLRVDFFTAIAGHADRISPGARGRQLAYLDTLTTTGVNVVLGHFKSRRWTCDRCGGHGRRFEEKETDVSIAVQLLDLLWNQQCELAVVVSADSDLAPAFRSAVRRFPSRPVYACFPYARSTDELRRIAARVFRLRKERYLAHQLPDPVLAPDGRVIRKPASW